MMTLVFHRYRPAVLEALLAHGLRPTPRTSPERVRDLLNDLYCHELRVLRARLRRGEFPKATYAGRVIEVRRRYPLLSVPLAAWTEVPADP